MRYSIEELRQYRDKYTEPIYSGFSLEALLDCRRNFASPHKRSENAYTIKIPITECEQYERVVRRELNKLTNSNFEIILHALQDDRLLHTEEFRRILVDIVHQKALLEPECSRNYAALCRDLADYDACASPKGGKKPSSLFRSDLIRKVRDEFERTLVELTGAEAEAAYGVKPGNSGEENAFLMEEGRSAYMRRKLANIRFIGQLYLHDVFSTTTMNTVLNQSLFDTATAKPSVDNIEAVVVLLTTIGFRLSADKQDLMKRAIHRLNAINSGYPKRIEYMIMGLCDLQKNGWRTREELLGQVASEKSHRGNGSGVGSPSSPLPGKNGNGNTNRFSGSGPSSSGGMNWREAASSNGKKETNGGKPSGANSKPNGGGKSSSAGSGGGKVATGVTKAASGKAEKAHLASSTAASASASPSFSPEEDNEREGGEEYQEGGRVASPGAVLTPSKSAMAPSFSPSFTTLVRTTLADWVEHCDNDFIANWTDLFAGCAQTLHSMDSLGEAVAAEVVSHACMTTRTSAQEEAASFCSVALDLPDADLLGGFAASFATAIEESWIEDCPKFPERWMRVLGLILNSQTDLYFDLGNICRDAYQHKMSITFSSHTSGSTKNADDIKEGSKNQVPTPVSSKDAAKKESEEEEDYIEDERAQIMDAMRSFWVYLPAPSEQEGMDVLAVIALIDSTTGTPKEGLETVLAGYLFHLHSLGVFPAGYLEILQQHESLNQPVLFKKVVTELHRAVYPPC